MLMEGPGVTTKSRTIPFSGGGTGFLDVTTWFNDRFVYDESHLESTYDPTNLTGSQITDSEKHPLWMESRRLKNVALPGDLGGGFRSVKAKAHGGTRYFAGSVTEQLSPSFKVVYNYDGPITIPGIGSFSFPDIEPSPSWALDVAGAQMVADCKPTNSIADLSTFLGELLSDGLPRLLGIGAWEARTRRARKKMPGNEYLNVEFGWKPLVGDVQAIAAAVALADAALKQYERDSGRVVRRRMNLPPKEETTSEIISLGARAQMWPDSQAFYTDEVPSGVVTLVKKRSVRRWFSGAFTYHLPTGYNSRNQVDVIASKAKHVFGIELTPEVLWNLTPWSWAFDWIGSMGDVISNLSDYATDGLVLKYGYVMEHKISTDTYTFQGDSGIIGAPSPASITLSSESKVRQAANPFGFGVSWDGLSARQLAILAALGISKGGI